MEERRSVRAPEASAKRCCPDQSGFYVLLPVITVRVEEVLSELRAEDEARLPIVRNGWRLEGII
jgi:hypothetical protein